MVMVLGIESICWPLVTRQDISHQQVWPWSTVMFLTLHFLSSGSARVLLQGELFPLVPEKREGEGACEREYPPRSLLVSHC